MNWDNIIVRLEKIVDPAIRAEVHALALICIGASMCLHGNKEEGELIIGAGLAVFRGKSLGNGQ